MNKVKPSLILGVMFLLSFPSLQAAPDLKKWAGTWGLKGAYRTQCTMNLVYNKDLHKCPIDEKTQAYDIKCALSGKILFSQGFEHTLEIIEVDHSSGPNSKIVIESTHPNGQAQWKFEWQSSGKLTGDGPLFKMRGKRDFAATCDPFSEECPNIDPKEEALFY